MLNTRLNSHMHCIHRYVYGEHGVESILHGNIACVETHTVCPLNDDAR